MAFDLEDATKPAAVSMEWLVLGAAYFLLLLFLIGVFDLFLSLYQLLVAGNFTDPNEVVGLLDSVLLLLVIVEVHRTLLAYAKGEPVLRIVVSASIIAVARRAISFRLEDYDTGQETVLAAIAIAVLVLALTLGYFLLDRVDIPDRPEL
ncbi:phosphate-starvation-inducible PsiE family protein [Halorubrum sp. Boch-26]|uniref:phosphate-starvation-inducible PsiE family protein n=1 Tax=Halorubrum sp. Boch-26 TaxID=2994426 RepID=UPI00246862B8|nr:phosphate-starvation-inducible PsiE family protein [Halorubrum sp. Boch-26]